MPVEIERRFLTRNDAWRRAVVRSARLRDGIVAASDGRKVRVRLYEDRATLTVKSRHERGRRVEFEYEIPIEHAQEMLALHCGADIIKKPAITYRLEALIGKSTSTRVCLRA